MSQEASTKSHEAQIIYIQLTGEHKLPPTQEYQSRGSQVLREDPWSHNQRDIVPGCKCLSSDQIEGNSSHRCRYNLDKQQHLVEDTVLSRNCTLAVVKTRLLTVDSSWSLWWQRFDKPRWLRLKLGSEKIARKNGQVDWGAWFIVYGGCESRCSPLALRCVSSIEARRKTMQAHGK